MNEEKFCGKCGAKNKAGAVFCSKCGASLKKEDQPKTQPAAEAKSTPKPISKPAPKPTPIKTEKAEESRFCPKCRAEVKKGVTFCPKCGANLSEAAQASTQVKTPSQPKPVSRQKQTATQNRTAPVVQKRQHKTRERKKLSRKAKVIMSIVAVLAIALGGFYAWGSQYYSRDKQIDWITNALGNPKKNATPYIIADSNSMKVTKSSLKPLQTYYKEHQTTVTRVNARLKRGFEYVGDLTLVQKGRYLLLFPKYQLQVKTYQPTVETNHADSKITMNGKKLGKLSSDGGEYTTKLGLLFPGTYNVKAVSQVAGRELTLTSEVDVTSNKTINMDIETKTFTVKSVPNGIVYINGEKEGTLNSKGELTLKSYPFFNKLKLYVSYNTGKNTIKSETISDLGSEIDNADEEYDDSEDSNSDYNDLASDDSSSTVTANEDGTYLVVPKWKGMVSTDDAKTIFEDAYNDPDSDDFVGGSSNDGYKQIKQENNNWDNSDKILSYDQKAKVLAVYPLSDTECQVVYRIDYTFEHEDDTHEQVFEYNGVIKVDDDDNYYIESLGSAKKISDTTTDNQLDLGKECNFVCNKKEVIHGK